MHNLEITGTRGIAKAVSTETEGGTAVTGIGAKGTVNLVILLRPQKADAKIRTPGIGTSMRGDLYRRLRMRRVKKRASKSFVAETRGNANGECL